jgi:hypothetical protein
LGLHHRGRSVPDYRCVLTLASWDRSGVIRVDVAVSAFSSAINNT